LHAIKARKEMMLMKKSGVILIVMALLLLPLWVGADETTIPPEMNWTPTPPARPTIDLVQLVQLLVAKGVISDQEYAQLIQPQSFSLLQSGQASAWTRDQAYRHPVPSRP
jgi:hypothetical protein